ncbi:16S rRNA (guanine1207-N2)-methyltransferase [Marinobacter zhejiangensis]|uniref:16S rRNA (Guanine1207-N2)-methyltransferase n=1 Tax=Marinobacter zhejiangensis TaxID=488535 RepID=A0A1I4NRW9_9GAMM|nr:16S rRNA (guanine1207-N2)-methyltransferase [Marinobacter zhejiangensis]
MVLNRPGSRGLQAWDAADELLIEAALDRLQPGQRVAVVDDGFGALTLALNEATPTTISDSASLAAALADNARANGLEVSAPLNWGQPPLGPFDAIVMRIPRQIDYLEYLLRWANEALVPGGLLIAGGMIKHIPDHGVGVFNRLVNTDQVLPARKKARVVVCSAGQAGLAGWERQWLGYNLPDIGLELRALPAVFARDHLDIGARMLVPQVRDLVRNLPEGGRVLDLACGNGVQGITALAERPDLKVVFSDVSSQAVASAKANVQAAFPEADTCFEHTDGISPNAGEFDLILLNPPFHEGGVVGDHIALRLFRQASQHLKRSGCLLVVGNRHLGYHKSLRRDFPRVSQLASDPKFVVFEAGY